MSGYPSYPARPGDNNNNNFSSGYPTAASIASPVATTGYSQYSPTAASVAPTPMPRQNIAPNPYAAAAANNLAVASVGGSPLGSRPAAAVGVPVAGAGGAGGATSTATGGQSEDFEDAVEAESKNFADRTMYLWDHYDQRQNPQIRSMREARTSKVSASNAALQILVLFNSIVTIMMLVTSWKRATDPTVVERFGADWGPLTNFMIFAPLGFFLIIFYILNNYAAERVFYDSLRKCILVDYPQSSELKYLFKHFQPIAFIVLFLAYFITTIAVMIAASASLGSIVTFASNMCVGIALAWYKTQGIEQQFVSLSDYIMTFPQKDRRYKPIEEREKERDTEKMDEYNLGCAAYFLKKVTLNEVKEPTYTTKMRSHNWKQAGYGPVKMFCMNLSIVLLVAACIGACVVYFFLLGETDISNTWTVQLNPCVATCANVSSALASSAGSASSFSTNTCNSCLCACVNNYHKNTPDYVHECAKNFVLPSHCGAVKATVAGMCSALPSTCPALVVKK